MLLDHFFTVAVPFVVVCVVVFKAAIPILERKGVYKTAEGAARRDAINRDYGTNLGAIVIALGFAGLWGLTLFELIERWGAIFFTFVVGALMIIPFLTVCACVITIYMYTVHGIANAKSK